jgi:restriction system protein
MQFKDAAFEILKQAGKPLHYNEITESALAASLLETIGKTPHATMGALLYTDTLKPDTRFRRGDERGTLALKTPAPIGIHQQAEDLQARVRQELRKYLLDVPAQKFEELIRSLLEEMGFDETTTTSYSNDKGVDVRGVLKTSPLSAVKVAIQAKRWRKNVGSDVVRDLRGSLKVADAEQGLIITPSGFTPGAETEAQAGGKTPITLIGGAELAELLIKYQVGVKQEQITVPSIDAEYWTELIGISLEARKEKAPTARQERLVRFPVPIQGKHHGEVFSGQLIDRKGSVRYRGTKYPTPSTAAKVIVTDWKEVNGWDFWKYLDPSTGKWEKIGSLREGTLP